MFASCGKENMEVTIGVASESPQRQKNKAAHGRSVSHLVLPKQTTGILRSQAYHAQRIVSMNFDTPEPARTHPPSDEFTEIATEFSSQTV